MLFLSLRNKKPLLSTTLHHKNPEAAERLVERSGGTKTAEDFTQEEVQAEASRLKSSTTKAGMKTLAEKSEQQKKKFSPQAEKC